eukprot:10244635-Lingulodinium_polyedra.AAC.1
MLCEPSGDPVVCFVVCQHPVVRHVDGYTIGQLHDLGFDSGRQLPKNFGVELSTGTVRGVFIHCC